MVFATHRDRIEDIARMLPDVERVEVRGRSRHADSRETQTQLWVGSPSALPAMIRPLVPPAMLQWQQQTVWDPAAWTAQWDIGSVGRARSGSAHIPSGATSAWAPPSANSTWPWT